MPKIEENIILTSLETLTLVSKNCKIKTLAIRGTTLTLFAENRGMSYFRNPSSKNRQILFLENPNILLTLLIYRITALVNNRSGSPLRTMESTDPEKIV